MTHSKKSSKRSSSALKRSLKSHKKRKSSRKVRLSGSSKRRSRRSGMNLRTLARKLEIASTPRLHSDIRGVTSAIHSTSGKKQFVIPHMLSINDIYDRKTYMYPALATDASVLGLTAYMMGNTQNVVNICSQRVVCKATNASSLDLNCKVYRLHCKRDVPSSLYADLMTLFNLGLVTREAQAIAIAAAYDYQTSDTSGPASTSETTPVQWEGDIDLKLAMSIDFNHYFSYKLVANVINWAPGLQRSFNLNAGFSTAHPFDDATISTGIVYKKGFETLLFEFYGEIVGGTVATVPSYAISTGICKLQFIVDKHISYFEVPKNPSTYLAGTSHVPLGDALILDANQAHFVQFAENNPTTVIDSCLN